MKELAAKLPDTILHSRAESTVKKYLGAFKRWKAWARQHGMAGLPVKECHVALHLQHLGDKTKSRVAVEGACNALTWIHFTAGLPSPMLSPFVKATLEGMQRILAKPTVKKIPLHQSCWRRW